MLNVAKENAVLSIDDIISYYASCCKQKTDFKLGLEYERISLDVSTQKNAKYKDLKKIIEHFASIKGWGILKDGNLTIGALEPCAMQKAATSISLEPGGQFEISLKPKKTIAEIEADMFEITELLDKIASVCNVEFKAVGITPNSTYQNIDIVRKNRYLIMADYLPGQGAFSPVMMRETAGIQVNVDYESEFDALQKLRIAAKMSPFLTGLFANSSVRAGKSVPYKSFRALAWKYTDRARSGLFYKNLLGKSIGGAGAVVPSFESYIDEILKVPMLFFERGHKAIEIKGKINFKEFMKYGFEGYQATFNDYILHSSLTFPDVRLKNCIEIRNHDSHKLPVAYAICALYKGILYSSSALCEAEELLKNFDGESCDAMGFLAAKNGLDFEVMCGGRNLSKIPAREIVKKLFEIAQNGLCDDEKKYLEAVNFGN